MFIVSGATERNGREDSFEDSRGAWWAPGYLDVDGNEVRNAPAAGVAFPKDAAGTAAVAQGNHEFGIGRGLIRSQQCHFHVRRDGAGDEQQIGMPGTCDEPDTEAFEIVKRIIEGVDLEFATVAGTRVNVSDAQSPPKHCKDAGIETVTNAQTFIGLGRRLGCDADGRDLAQCFQHDGGLQVMAGV
jgi:hypothetical protein